MIPRCGEGLIGALKDYTDTYVRGCTPPSSTTWKDPDNNVAFHNKTIVMTHNFTISIAAKWLDDSNNPALTPEQRAAGKKAYDETIITASFPQQAGRHADQIPFRRQDRADLRERQEQGGGQGIRQIPDAGGKPSALCRRRARPLVPGDDREPAEPVLAGRPPSQGGLHPVHRRHPPFDFTKNYKFTILNNENVWAKAMNRVVSEKVPVDKAVDELIARIKEVAG